MGRFFGWCALLGGLFAMAACGGNVVVDGNGNQGGTGGSGNGGTGGFGGSNVPTFCEQFCSSVTPYDCGIGSTCVSDCTSAFSGTPSNCVDELHDYLACYAAALPKYGCDPTDACYPEIVAYSDCISGTGTGGAGGGNTVCGDISCSGSSDGSCGCKGVCDGQTLAVECSPQGGSVACTCYQNGAQVGSCNDSNSSCDIELGCCAAYFGQGV